MAPLWHINGTTASRDGTRWHHRDAVRLALTGIEIAFMASAAESVDRVEQHRTFVDAAADARDDGVIRGPAADGRVALVAQDDIADAAVAVLRDPETHAGRAYDLTGPAALTLADVAATITEVTGRPVVYHPETVVEAYASRGRYQAPSWQLDAWVSTYVAIADGSLARVTTALPELTGHPARSLDRVLHDAERHSPQS